MKEAIKCILQLAATDDLKLRLIETLVSDDSRVIRYDADYWRSQYNEAMDALTDLQRTVKEMEPSSLRAELTKMHKGLTKIHSNWENWTENYEDREVTRILAYVVKDIDAVLNGKSRSFTRLVVEGV